jgi:serine/threonine-protein kinase
MADIVVTPLEKSVVFRMMNLLMLNLGRPAKANEFLERMDGLRTSPGNTNRFAIISSIFDDGDVTVGDSAARRLERFIAHDTLNLDTRDKVRLASAAMITISLWYLEKGDMIKTRAGTDWLRRHAQGQPRNRVFSMLPEMLMASRLGNPDGAPLRATVDSITRDGCCEFPEFLHLSLARAYEASGDEAAALRVIRRGVWYLPSRMLSAYLRDEGRLAARVGNRAEAIQAYEHFLALRWDPEPALLPQRDSIRATVARLKRAR